MDARERDWLLKEKYEGVESDEFRKDLVRLEAGEPVAYVIGFVPFLGCRIDLSRRTLIPRPETEYWAERAIDDVRAAFGSESEIRILDVFSGSGCIGIAALKRLPNAKADFADIEQNALVQVKINLDLNGIDPSRYVIYQSDVFDGIPAGMKYHAIFANPPYIAEADKDSRVDRSVLDHEPHTALFAEEKGFALIKKTFDQAKNIVAPDGRFFLEHDDLQKDAIEKLARESGFLDAVVHLDQFGLSRWVSAVAPTQDSIANL